MPEHYHKNRTAFEENPYNTYWKNYREALSLSIQDMLHNYSSKYRLNVPPNVSERQWNWPLITTLKCILRKGPEELNGGINTLEISGNAFKKRSQQSCCKSNRNLTKETLQRCYCRLFKQQGDDHPPNFQTFISGNNLIALGTKGEDQWSTEVA